MQQLDPVTLEVIEDIDSLAALSSEWSSLYDADDRATPFQSPEWLIPWARQFCNDLSSGKLFTVTAREHGSLAAVLPLYIYTEPAGGLRQLLLLGAGTSDYLNGIFSPEASSAIISRVAELLRGYREMWDVAHLSQIRSHSPLLNLACVPSLRWKRCDAEPCFRISTGQPLPAKIKGNLGYYRRRAQAIGALTCEFADAAHAIPFFEALAAMQNARWHDQGEPAALADSRVQAHHRETIPLLYSRGLLRLGALLLEESVISLIYALADPLHRAHRSFYFYLNGFDSNYHSLSPGTLVIGALLERARREGAEYLDFLRGDEKYKILWRVKPVPTFKLEAVPGKDAF